MLCIRDLSLLDTALGYVLCLRHVARDFLEIQLEISPKLSDLCGLGVALRVTKHEFVTFMDSKVIGL